MPKKLSVKIPKSKSRGAPKKLIIEKATKKHRSTVPKSAFKPGNEFAFQPGTSGNPSGRPANDLRLVSRALRAQLGTRAPAQIVVPLGLSVGASWAQCVSAALLFAAANGDVRAATEIRESVEGSRSRLDVFQENFTDERTEPAPIFRICLVESDGDGRSKPGQFFDGKEFKLPEQETPEAPQLPAPPGTTD